MIPTLFSVCLKYLQLERSLRASHHHLCLCGPRQTVPFGLCASRALAGPWQGSRRACKSPSGICKRFFPPLPSGEAQPHAELHPSAISLRGCKWREFVNRDGALCYTLGECGGFCCHRLVWGLVFFLI